MPGFRLSTFVIVMSHELAKDRLGFSLAAMLALQPWDDVLEVQYAFGLSDGPCAKTSQSPLVSAVTRFEAMLWNTTKRPSAEIDGRIESWFAWAPLESTLARSVLAV